MADAMKLVPVDPTEAMIEAAVQVASFYVSTYEEGVTPVEPVSAIIYRAMLAASPPAREEAPADNITILVTKAQSEAAKNSGKKLKDWISGVIERAVSEAPAETMAAIYEEILRTVCGHLGLPQSESGPADDVSLYDRALENLLAELATTEAEKVEHRKARYVAEAALYGKEAPADPSWRAEYNRVEAIREAAEGQDRIARSTTDPIAKSDAETQAAGHWSRYEREVAKLNEEAPAEGAGEGEPGLPEQLRGMAREYMETMDEAQADVLIRAAKALEEARHPAPATADKLRAFDVEGYVEDYEFRGDEGDYTPTEDEKGLLIDAIHSVLAALNEGGEG
jgi:hypothetical protein